MNLYNTIAFVNSVIWGKWGIYTLLATGVYASFKLGFFQLRHGRLCAERTLFKKSTNSSGTHAEHSISPFQTLCTSLAATIGVGNITGVASAICIGGPGAVFWMWVAAFFGMMTKYSEIVLGIYFRRKNFDGKWSGGAMYYLRDGIGSIPGLKRVGRVLGAMFALFTVFTSFGMGCIGQVNKIVINMVSAFPISGASDFKYSIIWGVFLFLSALLIVAGGLKRTAAFSEKIVPAMVLCFIGGSLLVIVENAAYIIPSFKAIFSMAFTPHAGAGGIFGTLFSNICTQGFKRGVFSNEAGLGSSVLVHASTSVKEPCEQGMWGILEVFIDTVLVCGTTALVILTSGVHTTTASDATMVAKAFSTVFGSVGEDFVAVMILVFAFTSVIAWNQYGCVAWEYMFGSSSAFIYKTAHLLLIIPASVMTSEFAWEISDIFNGLMMLPNLIGIILLMNTVKKITVNYTDRTLRKKRVLPMISYFSKI